MKIVDRLEWTQAFKHSCNVKRYVDEKNDLVSCCECSTMCLAFAQKSSEKVMEMLYTETLNLHGDHKISGRKRRVK
jgi:hypothetical protein